MSTSSTISAKTLALIERAKKLSSKPTGTHTSPAILNRSALSETSPTFNSPHSPLTSKLDAALNHIAKLEDGAKKSAELLAFALDRLAKLEEQVSRCPTTPNSQLTPSTPSVANTGKRAFLIWTSVLLFGNEVTFLSGLGTAVVILGVLLYNVALGVDARALGLPRIVQVGSDKMFTQRV